MLNKNIFFNKYYSNSKKFKKNLKQTKFLFNSLVSDIENFKVPLLNSYKKDYEFDFSRAILIDINIASSLFGSINNVASRFFSSFFLSSSIL